MARGLAGAVMKGLGTRDHLSTVVGTELVASHLLRVRMHSPTVFEDVTFGPTTWLRFWFPDPEGGETEHQRAYTLTEADPETGSYAFDVVLHDPSGPASLWARRAKAGDQIVANLYGSAPFEVPRELPAGYLLIGDSASLPAINSLLAVLPATVSAEVYLEQHVAADRELVVVEHPRARVHWIPRQGAESLAAAIERRDWSDWYVWMATEADSLKHLRTLIRDEFGFPKTSIHLQAYWNEGRAFGKKRGDGPAVEYVPSAEEAAQEPASIEVAAAAAVTAAPTKGSWRGQSGAALLRPLRGAIILSGLLQAIVTLLQLAPFVLLAELSRRLLADAPSAELRSLGSWALTLMGLGALLDALLLLWLHVLDARFARDVRQRLLSKLARLPLGWFNERTSGSVKQIVQDDTLALHYLTTHAVPDAVAAVVAPLAVLGYLIAVDWRLGLLLFIPVVVYIALMAVMLMQSGDKPARAQHWAERMTSEAGAYLEGQPVIRVFGGVAASSFRTRLSEYIKFLDDWQRPFTGKKTLIDLATRPGTFLLLIVVFGTMFITGGSLEPTDLVPFLLLGTTFGVRLLGIGFGLSGLRDGLLSAGRIQFTLAEHEIAQQDGRAKLAEPAGRVVFDAVTFGYRPGVPVVQGVDIVLEPETTTALVGPSGSGKSTLAGLLARFHDVDSGAIRIGGRDLRSFTSDELYTTVGFVLQNAQLVQASVRDNIALAVPGATAEQIEAAARAAQIHDRIAALPQGYDTLLGPDAALSGGERQRLAIARAILADPEVLVLDEATAFADPESEYLVQQALSRLTAERTVLVIAHRLHTITGVDQIVVLDDGRVAEVGTHKQLLAAKGRYRALWEAGRPSLSTSGGSR